MAGFTRVFASGVLLLLATTTTQLVRLVDGASSSTGDSTVACGAELIACQEDQTCITSCLQDWDMSQETEECIDAIGLDSPGASLSVLCDGVVASVCCLDTVSDDDCLENNAFVDVWLCYLGTTGCSNDEITCNGAKSSAVLGVASTAVAVGVSSVFMLLLTLVWT